MKKDLPNGFTGFSKKKPGFESAADALKRSRFQAQSGHTDSEQRVDGLAANGWQPEGSQHLQSHNPRMERASQTQNAWGAGAAFFPADMRKYLRVPDLSIGEKAPVYDEKALSEIPEADRRWAWVQVDLGAIHNNVLSIKRLLQPSCMLMAVVKADGYGHGAVQCARTAINSGADYLGVATVDEAMELRRANITAPILVLAEPPASAIPLLLAYQIMPSIYSVEFAVQYGEAADSVGCAAPYHLKVNTGMNRIGVRYDEVLDFLKRVAFHRALKLVGTYTHFATSDVTEAMEFRIQENHFHEALDKMRDAGIDPGIVHAANSAAIMRYPEVHFDMVRLGISMYGYYPCPETYGVVELIPAMSVHARITQVKNVPVGEGVSYGLVHRSGGFAKTCTIPIGYADGFSRGLSGRTDIIMAGSQFPQVGMICMDQSMFEVDLRSRRAHGGSGKFDPQVGDEVMVVGASGNAVVTIDEMAEKLYTIPHEIAIGFGCSRLPRVYT